MMTDDKNSPMLTKLQAYDAMFHFLEAEYELCPSDEIGGLLGSMSRKIRTDGLPADPAVVDQWDNAVAKVLYLKDE